MLTSISEEDKKRFPLYSRVILVPTSFPEGSIEKFGVGLVKGYIKGVEEDPGGAFISVDFDCFEGHPTENLWVKPHEIEPTEKEQLPWEDRY